MTPATRPVHRPPSARLLVADATGVVSHCRRDAMPDLLRRGDLLVVNDAATLPASLSGVHEPTGHTIEVRLAGRGSLAPACVRQFSAVVFGSGDFRTRTEDRPAPPRLRSGDRLTLGPLRASIARLLGHPRLVLLEFDGSPGHIWSGLAHHGHPIQYAHLSEPLALWDTWTTVAAAPVAFEPPSAGFFLSWSMLRDLHVRGVDVASLTHAAGISSTGDAALDSRLPLDEPYSIPSRTVGLIEAARARGGRVIAVGTTVVRALEHAACVDGRVHPGPGIATQRIDAKSSLRVVDALISGTHEAGTSHHELLRAFIGASLLERIDRELDALGYLTHEFGDSVFVESSLAGILAATSHSRGISTRRESAPAPSAVSCDFRVIDRPEHIGADSCDEQHTPWFTEHTVVRNPIRT
jgi:S-adenosylmethionine:tRNA ribosyltransferase-isomerase